MPPLRMDLEGHLATWASVTSHFEARTLEAGLPGISMPVIFIHGQLDPIPYSEIERSAALLPGARLEILPSIGHFPWEEEPGIMRRLLEEFVEASRA